MVAGERHLRRLLLNDEAFLQDDPRRRGSDGEDRHVWRVQDGVEVVDPVHA
jgi:hypothetical protein